MALLIYFYHFHNKGVIFELILPTEQFFVNCSLFAISIQIPVYEYEYTFCFHYPHDFCGRHQPHHSASL